MEERREAETSRLVMSVQFINYAILLFFCINLLKVIDIRQLNRNGWILFAVSCILCILVAIYPKLDMIKDISKLGLPNMFVGASA